MSVYKCPKGHESTESDFCSVCGAKIEGATELATAKTQVTSAVPQTATINCPDCTAPHEPNSGNFCEICGYNFITGGHGEVPPVALKSTPVDFVCVDAVSTAVVSTAVVSTALEVVITIDPSLGEEGSPEPPINQAPITFRLDKETNLIGRRNDRRGIYPDIALDLDDAVSHRHALLNRQPDGTFILRDIGSTNGTKLNGVELKAMVDTPIKEGDEFTLGYWTRIEVKVVRQL